uniref:trichohyalin isoform X2 n=1 Tax=Ciona intestinalis TaxID=7719 RepID=UPI000EF4AADE|nr:trichohyalin isoform X2 [Ciona intestinalis]|eukprot:XP_026696037.1 trichohyalin isoform X2 [Ciona intestinalis]
MVSLMTKSDIAENNTRTGRRISATTKLSNERCLNVAGSSFPGLETKFPSGKFVQHGSSAVCSTGVQCIAESGLLIRPLQPVELIQPSVKKEIDLLKGQSNQTILKPTPCFDQDNRQPPTAPSSTPVNNRAEKKNTLEVQPFYRSNYMNMSALTSEDGDLLLPKLENRAAIIQEYNRNNVHTAKTSISQHRFPGLAKDTVREQSRSGTACEGLAPYFVQSTLNDVERLPAIHPHVWSSRDEKRIEYRGFVSALPMSASRPGTVRDKFSTKIQKTTSNKIKTANKEETVNECWRCALRMEHSKCETTKYIRIGGGFRHSYWFVRQLIEQAKEEEEKQLNLLRHEQRVIFTEKLAWRVNSDGKRERRIKTFVRSKSGRRIEKYEYVSEDVYNEMVSLNAAGKNATHSAKRRMKEKLAASLGLNKEDANMLDSWDAQSVGADDVALDDDGIPLLNDEGELISITDTETIKRAKQRRNKKRTDDDDSYDESERADSGLAFSDTEARERRRRRRGFDDSDEESISGRRKGRRRRRHRHYSNDSDEYASVDSGADSASQSNRRHHRRRRHRRRSSSGSDYESRSDESSHRDRRRRRRRRHSSRGSGYSSSTSGSHKRGRSNRKRHGRRHRRSSRSSTDSDLDDDSRSRKRHKNRKKGRRHDHHYSDSSSDRHRHRRRRRRHHSDSSSSYDSISSSEYSTSRRKHDRRRRRKDKYDDDSDSYSEDDRKGKRRDTHRRHRRRRYSTSTEESSAGDEKPSRRRDRHRRSRKLSDSDSDSYYSYERRRHGKKKRPPRPPSTDSSSLSSEENAERLAKMSKKERKAYERRRQEKIVRAEKRQQQRKEYERYIDKKEKRKQRRREREGKDYVSSSSDDDSWVDGRTAVKYDKGSRRKILDKNQKSDGRDIGYDDPDDPWNKKSHKREKKKQRSQKKKQGSDSDVTSSDDKSDDVASLSKQNKKKKKEKGAKGHSSDDSDDVESIYEDVFQEDGTVQRRRMKVTKKKGSKVKKVYEDDELDAESEYDSIGSADADKLISRQIYDKDGEVIRLTKDGRRIKDGKISKEVFDISKHQEKKKKKKKEKQMLEKSYEEEYVEEFMDEEGRIVKVVKKRLKEKTTALGKRPSTPLTGQRRVQVLFLKGGTHMQNRLKQLLEKCSLNDSDPRFSVLAQEHGTSDLDEKEGAIDYLSHYRLVEPASLEIYGKAFLVEDRDENYLLNMEETRVALEGIPSLQGMSDKQINYILKVLGIDETTTVTFKMFAVVCALCERFLSIVDDQTRQWMEINDLADMERKIGLYRAMFYWNTSSDRSSNYIKVTSLRIELIAGGLSRAQEDYVINKIEPNPYREVSFIDYMAFIPLFLITHESIIDNPLDMSRDKISNDKVLEPQRDMVPLGRPMTKAAATTMNSFPIPYEFEIQPGFTPAKRIRLKLRVSKDPTVDGDRRDSFASSVY